MRIVSWNINGFESTLRKGGLESVLELSPDIICLQELKCSNNELLSMFATKNQYEYFFSLAEKKGYSGVSVFTKKHCDFYSRNSGNVRMNKDGRYLRLDLGDIILYNIYMIHGNRDKRDYQPKIEACNHLINTWKQDLENKREIVVATDFNIAHNDIDVYYFKKNRNNIMFTEREKRIIDVMPLKDAFRAIYEEKISYSWWPYAFCARERNIGWRIDYFFVSEKLIDKINDIVYMKDILGSDHCPICMDIVNK